MGKNGKGREKTRRTMAAEKIFSRLKRKKRPFDQRGRGRAFIGSVSNEKKRISALSPEREKGSRASLQISDGPEGKANDCFFNGRWLLQGSTGKKSKTVQAGCYREEGGKAKNSTLFEKRKGTPHASAPFSPQNIEMMSEERKKERESCF